MHSRFACVAWLALLAMAVAAPPAAGMEAREILDKSDKVRNPDASFSLTTSLLEYKAGKLLQTMTLRAYSSADPRTGQFRSLVRFDAPPREAGKLILKNGNDLWFFDPSSKATIRVAPQQRLIGQAANGDVVTTNFAVDYDARILAEEEISDGDRKPVACIKLGLEARSSDVTYHSAELWVAKDDFRPVKVRFFVESGKLLKTAYYRRLRSELGRLRPTEVVIIDGLDNDWVTLMRFDGYATRTVPETWFQRDYLPRFTPE